MWANSRSPLWERLTVFKISIRRFRTYPLWRLKLPLQWLPRQPKREPPLPHHPLVEKGLVRQAKGGR